jgi:glycerophosphoryl diester phosphodiesterase
MVSFERAIELGADALETDLHLTADGRLVASHDPTLARMSGDDVVIRRSTLAELRRRDVGWGFVNAAGERPYAGRDLRVPTLDELLDAFPRVPFNVDVKQHDQATVDALMVLLRRKRAEARVTVASFDAATLRRVRRSKYPGRTGLGLSDALKLYALPEALLRVFPPAGTAVQVPTHFYALRTDTARFLAKCHALSLRVDYWTINTAAEAERLLAAGADGIMTDDPAAIAPVFRRLRGA